MFRISYCIGHKESPTKLAKALSENGVAAEITRDTENIDMAWGKNAYALPTSLHEPMNGRINRNKCWQLRTLQDAGVPVIDFTQDANVANEWLHNGHYVIKRQLMHERNSGIEVFVHGCNVEINGGEYCTKYEFCHSEFRFHIVDGLSVAMYEKPRSDRFIIYQPNEEQWQGLLSIVSLREISKAAVKAVRYDFGGVDILGNGKVLEINTAPELSNSSIVYGYVNAIKRRLARDIPLRD